MKRSVVIQQLLYSILILLWFYTAMSKIVNHEEFKVQLNNQVFTKGQANVLFYALPTIELIVAMLLAFDKTRMYGFIFSSLLMITFTTYVGLILLNHFDRTPCSCGGVLKFLGWKSHFIFNLFFTLIAGWGATLKLREWNNKRKERRLY